MKNTSTPAPGESAAPSCSAEDEELIRRCVEIASVENKASTSLFQRRLRLGYARAARILDIMEERGYVGPGAGAQPRVILQLPELPASDFVVTGWALVPVEVRIIVRASSEEHAGDLAQEAFDKADPGTRKQFIVGNSADDTAVCEFRWARSEKQNAELGGAKRPAPTSCSQEP